MIKAPFLIIVLLTVPLSGICQHQNHNNDDRSDANDYMLQSSHEDLAKIFDATERDAWQQPEKVIGFLGDIESKTIVDVGSGSGYFSFRLAKAGARVIAADIDTTFLQIIEKKRQQLNIDTKDLLPIHLSEDELNIENNSADIIFFVNVYHHISNRVNYFSNVNTKLKKNGKIVIIDFYKKNLPVGPPKHHKISKEIVEKELTEAGYNNLDVNTELLEYQYIISVGKF